MRKKSKKDTLSKQISVRFNATLEISLAILKKSSIRKGCDLYDNKGVIIPFNHQYSNSKKEVCVIRSIELFMSLET